MWSSKYNATKGSMRSEEHTSELQSLIDLVCRLLLEKKKAGARTALGSRPKCLSENGDEGCRTRAAHAALHEEPPQTVAAPLPSSPALFFFSNEPAPPAIYPLPLPAPLPT